MEFGQVPENTLNHINFSLPNEPLLNTVTIKGIKPQNAKVYTGCNMWGRKEWVDKIYPAKTKEKDFLTEYSKQYNSVELNATHYKIYDKATLHAWCNKVYNNNFLFCAKMFKGITHDGGLLNKQLLTTQFLNSVAALDKNLGPIFIQLSHSFSPKRKDELFAYLKTLTTEFQFFLELRHADWFVHKNTQTELFNFLQQHNIGAVITDTAGYRYCTHMHLTIPKTFIRFVGNSLHETDYSRINQWVQRINFWLQNGLEEVYFFVHMPNEAKSPELSAHVIDSMNKVCHLNIQKPLFINHTSTQSSLF